MRRAAKTDANHAAVRDGLRELGYRVQDLSAVGGGMPDLLVGLRRHLFLLEVKDGSKPPSARKRTAIQLEWHAGWEQFPVFVVVSVEDSVAQISEWLARLR